MPYVASAPIIKSFTLERTDKEYGVEDGPTTIMVRQATMREKAIRDYLYDKDVKRTFEEDGAVSIMQDVSNNTVVRKEVFLTLAGCNITKADKTPLFKFVGDRAMDENEFNEAWGALLPLVADEIFEKVLEVNPMWDFRPKAQSPLKDI